MSVARHSETGDVRVRAEQLFDVLRNDARAADDARHTKEQVAAALPMQIRLAETSALIDTAKLLVRDVLDLAQQADPVTLELRVRNRRALTFAMRLLTQAVDGLIETAVAILDHGNPRVLAGYVIMNFNATAENYGRMALGIAFNP